MAPVVFAGSKHQSLLHKKTKRFSKRDSSGWFARPTFLLPDSATNSPDRISRPAFSSPEPKDQSPRNSSSTPSSPITQKGRLSTSPIPQHLPLTISQTNQRTPPPRPPRPENSLPNLRPTVLLRPSALYPQDFRVPSPDAARLRLARLSQIQGQQYDERVRYQADSTTKHLSQSPSSPSNYSLAESFYSSPQIPDTRSSSEHTESFPSFPLSPPPFVRRSLPPLIGEEDDDDIGGFHQALECETLSSDEDCRSREIRDSKEKIIIAIEEAHHTGVWLDTNRWNLRRHRRALILIALASILLITGGITAALVVTLRHH